MKCLRTSLVILIVNILKFMNFLNTDNKYDFSSIEHFINIDAYCLCHFVPKQHLMTNRYAQFCD